MTRLGKILVLGNLVLSVAMAIWALGLYTSSRLGATEAAAAQKAGGKAYTRAHAEMLELQAKVTTLNKALSEAAVRWQQAHDSLVAKEFHYYDNPPVYQQLLQDVESAQGNLQSVAYKNGEVELDPRNPSRPALIPAYDPPLTAADLERVRRGQAPAGGNEVLRSASFYRPKIDEANKAFDKLSKDLTALVKQSTDLTIKLAGQPPLVKGLWVKLAEEQTKHKQILAEADDLREVWTKSLIDGDQLARRQQQMQARAAELESKIGTRTTRP